eukprot:scaffold19299_cov103-Skeletonema_marinoi.AAC.1
MATCKEEMLEEEMFALKESLKNLTNPTSQCTGGDETKYAKNETDSDSTEDYESGESGESTEHEASQKMDTEHSPKSSANTASEKKLAKKATIEKAMEGATEGAAKCCTVELGELYLNGEDVDRDE